jgi:hypothetical protein
MASRLMRHRARCLPWCDVNRGNRGSNGIKSARAAQAQTLCRVYRRVAPSRATATYVGRVSSTSRQGLSKNGPAGTRERLLSFIGPAGLSRLREDSDNFWQIELEILRALTTNSVDGRVSVRPGDMGSLPTPDDRYGWGHDHLADHMRPLRSCGWSGNRL